MKRLLNILEGSLIGFLVSRWLVIMGDAISGTSIGIAITVILCTVVGCVLNRFSGAFAGLIAGGSAVLIGNMVSQTSFGMVTTILVGAFLGALVAWELTHGRKPEIDSSGHFAR